MADLRGKTLFITGASRGIGEAIAICAARDGANVALVAKTDQPHPKLPGTIHTAAAAVERAGGKPLACVTDIRFEEQVQAAVDRTVAVFGGIDILVNNASALFLAGTLETPMKRYDLIQAVNVRGTFLCSKLCLPHLLRASNPHILNISPPLGLEAQWFKDHLSYTISKFGMSMCVLGMAEEFRESGVAVNALWPKVPIATAAVRNLLGGDAAVRHCRKPEFMAEAARAILVRDSRRWTGNFLLDEDVLREEGVTDFDAYAVCPGERLAMDFFVSPEPRVDRPPSG